MLPVAAQDVGRHRGYPTSFGVADEHTVRVEWHGCDIRTEDLPDAVSLQVRLDIRYAERADDGASIPQKLSDRAQRLGACKVADNRHDQVLLLHRFDEHEVLFICEVGFRRP